MVDESFPGYKSLLRVVSFRERFKFFNHTGPAAAVVFASLRFLSETTVLYLHVRAGYGRSQLPAHNCFFLRVQMPVRKPGVNEHPWRIDFRDLALAFEFVYSVHNEVTFLGGVAVAAAQTRIHPPELDWAACVGEPVQQLLGIGQCLENAARWRRDVDLGDDGILIGRDDGF